VSIALILPLSRLGDNRASRARSLAGADSSEYSDDTDSDNAIGRTHPLLDLPREPVKLSTSLGPSAVITCHHVRRGAHLEVCRPDGVEVTAFWPRRGANQADTINGETSETGRELCIPDARPLSWLLRSELH
jgi:hypothetical protein